MADPGPPTEVDLAHLERARVVARAGWGRVHPNPMVGCVLARGAAVVGEGWHREFGGPHAEVVALDAAGDAARGATAYVSLEPCAHHGKTPPCTDALLRSGVTRVVFGAADPGERSGGGARRLREGGIEVVGPLWDTATARAENPFFFHAARDDTPFVALKLALTLDGRIAGAPGTRTRISGPEADRWVHGLRSGFDAILVGAGTARVDDPRLTVRLTPETGRGAPRRLVLDPSGRLRSDAALFADTTVAPVHLFTRRDAPEADMERLEAAGAHVHPVDGKESRLDLSQVLGLCREIGIATVLCEGGARLAGSLLRERRVDRLYLLVAPRTLGAGAVPAFGEGESAPPWDDFAPVLAPEAYGRDTLIVLDRRVA